MKLNQLRKRANEQGFTLIELMIVVAIIGILAAIAIPNFLGMQEKAKRRSVEEAATSAKADLHNWLAATLNGETGVIDFNGDGVVAPGEGPATDLTSVPAEWIAAFVSKTGAMPMSPWFGSVSLLQETNAVVSGVVTLSRLTGNRGIVIRGFNKEGTEVYRDTVSVD